MISNQFEAIMKKLFFFIPLLFFGCAPSLTYINPKYGHADFKSNKMVICPLNSQELKIENADDVVDDFGKTDKRKPNDVVRDSCFYVMQEDIIKNEKSIKVEKISNTIPIISLSQNAFFTITRKVGNDSIPLSFAIPQRDSIQLHPDIILILNSISFSRSSGSAGSATPGMGGGSLPSLNSTFNYLLWSYADSEAISYGQTHAETPFLFGMTHATWITHFVDISHVVFSKTPFPVF
jgi:hypothetical protein